jgi:hypothetical protein
MARKTNSSTDKIKGKKVDRGLEKASAGNADVIYIGSGGGEKMAVLYTVAT